MASLLVIAWYTLALPLMPSLDDGLGSGVVYLVLTEAVCAIGLIACAVLAAWLVARRRRRPHDGETSERSPLLTSGIVAK